MSNLTDNWFYPSAEPIWLCIRLNNAGKYCDITFYDFGKKKIIFSDEAHFDLGGYVNKQNCRNPHAYIVKPTHPKRVTVCCGFFANEQGEAVTDNGDYFVNGNT